MTITEQLAAALRQGEDKLDWLIHQNPPHLFANDLPMVPLSCVEDVLQPFRAAIAAYDARPAASDDVVERVARAIEMALGDGDYVSDKWFGRSPKKSDATLSNAARAAIAAMAAPAPADGWQDIATAPRDGTRVLLWMEPYDPIESREQEPSAAVIGSYVVWSPMMKQQGMKDGWSWYGSPLHYPTRWRPLPPAPATEAKGSGQ